MVSEDKVMYFCVFFAGNESTNTVYLCMCMCLAVIELIIIGTLPL